MKEISLGLEDCNIRASIRSFPRKPLKSDCNQSLTCHAALATAENELLIDIFNAQLCASVLKKGGNLGMEDEDKTISTDFMARVKECTRFTNCASAAPHPISSHFGARGRSLNPSSNWKADLWDSHGEYPVVGFLDADYGGLNLLQHSSNSELQLQQTAVPNENSKNNPLNGTTQKHDGIHCDKSTESTSDNAGGLQTSLAATKRELEIQTQMIRKEREAARVTEKELKNILTEKEDLLKTLRGENDAQKVTNEGLREALDSKEEKLSDLHDDLEDQLRRITEALEKKYEEKLTGAYAEVRQIIIPSWLLLTSL